MKTFNILAYNFTRIFSFLQIVDVTAVPCNCQYVNDSSYSHTVIIHNEGEWPPMRTEFNPTYVQDMSHSLVGYEDENFSFTS